MLAPNQVNAPATTQTSSIPPNDGTARLTSDGCTKIDEPTIVPTTIAVACVSPMVRRRGREPFSAVRVGSGTVSAIQPVVSRSSSLWTRILSPDRRRLAGRLLVDRLDRRERVGFRRRFVATIAFHARETQREAAGILRARLEVVERDLGNDVGLEEHRVGIAPDLELEEALRLPREHLVGEALEGLAEHDEAAAFGVPRAEVQVAQPPFAPATPPLDRENHEIERTRLLHLQPRGAAPASRVDAVNRLRHHAFV